MINGVKQNSFTMLQFGKGFYYEKIRFCLVILISFVFLISAFPVWAASTTVGQKAAILSLEETGFRMEIPSRPGEPSVQVTADVTDYDRITPVENFYVTRAVDISIIKSAGFQAQLGKAARLVFSFNEIDFKRASRMNTGLSVGHFRIGYWDNSGGNWIELPSQVFWNGSSGVVEAETHQGAGRYALIWSFKEETKLSSIADEAIRVMVDLKTVPTAVSPYMKDGRTMVPLRVVAENLNASVDWIESESRIDLTCKTDRIQLWIGKTEARKNKDTMKLDVAPEVIDGRTFVPLRFVAEAFGAKVTWDDATQTAKVFSN